MIDTIVLTLQQNEYVILDHDMFEPSTKGLFEYPYYRLGKRGYYSCYQNPTKTELRNGNYKPRLTVTRHVSSGGYPVSLRVEFSVPKLLYGNNFDEVTEKDFDSVITILKQKLLEMGVSLRPGIRLEDVQVSGIHYSKNIILTDYTTSNMIINEIAKLDLGKRLDVNMRDYRNGGAIIKFHCNSYELAFYDKIKDLEQARVSENRAEEKDNSVQYGLFDEFDLRKPYEVFRIEIRLNKRYKIHDILKKLGHNKSLTFSNLFKDDISRNVIKDVWSRLIEQSRLLYCSSLPLIELCESLRALNPQLPISYVLQISSFIQMSKETNQRRIRNLIESNSSQTWYKFIKKFKNLNLPTSGNYELINSVYFQLV